jgi:DNA-binding NarL/FixJ family response regulator
MIGKTVSHYRVLGKLGVTNRTEAVREGLRGGWIAL